MLLSTRERCHVLLDGFSDAVLEEVTAYFEALKRIDEAKDMAYCLEIALEAESDPDKETASFDEGLAALGLNYADIQS